MKLVYLVQYFSPEKASGLQLVEDLLEGFSAHGWKTDVFTPTPTRGVTDEQRKEYARKRVEIKYDGRLTFIGCICIVKERASLDVQSDISCLV